MKRLLTIASLVAAATLPLAQAQQRSTAAADPPSKVAVIAFQAAVAKTNEGQTSFAQLEKKYQPKQDSITNLKTQVDTLTKQLQTDGPKLTDSERAARAKSIDDKSKELDRTAQEARTDFQQDISQAYGALAEKVYGVMKAYAEQNGYTLVLDYSSQQSPVLFAGQTTDITEAVIAAYNTKSGVPAPSPSAQGQAVPDAPAPAARPPAGH
ncbi:MAG TPA: OmpH family outer membrane protein [Candidatus Angelobacter sp.]|nr:OmpH family outer membrane protein [Candidatus Angelobacter sp.]